MAKSQRRARNENRPKRSKFQKHIYILVWKAYLQRYRRGKILIAETVFSSVLFLIAIYIAKPVFLTPLEAEPEPARSFSAIVHSLPKDIIIGYEPNRQPYASIMHEASELLDTEMLSARDENDLDAMLYNLTNGNKILNKVIWVLWLPEVGNVYRFKIRSTEDAVNRKENVFVRYGFDAVQLAISHAILGHVSEKPVKHELSLISMPVSPLMDDEAVKRVISLILMCYTLALLPPTLETEVLVVTETANRFKKALRIRSVDYNTMYISWMMYALMTALPSCVLGSITLILIFRWIHLLYAIITLLAYFCIMVMLSLIMAMFNTKAKIACVWSTLQTLLQTFLAELLVHHKYDFENSPLKFLMHTMLPPLGLLSGLREFALLQTGSKSSSWFDSIAFTILSWSMLNFLYFLTLMLLQRTIGSERAIGGQVSWKAIIFKTDSTENELRPVEEPKADWCKIQDVDEHLAKAVSFRDVSKTIMGVPILNSVTFDIYRGEFSLIFSERIQEKLMLTIEDLLTGLTLPDTGTVNVLGVQLSGDRNLLCEPLMVGYCDNSCYLIDDLTVEEHLTFYAQICLWQESTETILEYSQIRMMQLLEECDLDKVRLTRVRHLGTYYRAQLCWAIATLLEPRIIIEPSNNDDPQFEAVMKDKIERYKKHLTIIKISLSSWDLVYADRLFLLDTRVLVFSGTPAYMFFKYGREYRIRLNFKVDEHAYADNLKELFATVKAQGVTIRAHLGTLLILRIPTFPSDKVSAIVNYLQSKSEHYGIVAMNISLPDAEEVFRKAIHQSRTSEMLVSKIAKEISKAAVKRLSGN